MTANFICRKGKVFMKRNFSVIFILSLASLFLAAAMLSTGASTDRGTRGEEFIKKSRRVLARGDYNRQLLLRESGSQLYRRQSSIEKEANKKAWVLDPEAVDQLNPALQRAVLRDNGLLEKPQPRGRERDIERRFQLEPQVAAGDNMRIN